MNAKCKEKIIIIQPCLFTKIKTSIALSRFQLYARCNMLKINKINIDNR